MVSDPADVAAVLALSDERDRQQAYRLTLARELYLAGFADGSGAAVREADEEWRQTPPLRVTGEPTHAELEERRWGPGGRDHFGDPRPGDRTPREAA